MYLAEILIRKDQIKSKIKEIQEYVKVEPRQVNVDSAVKILLKLLDNLKSHLILIDEINISNKIEIGGSSISISNAIKLRNILDSKVEFITSIMRKNECGLDFFGLLDQRDKLMEERIIIDRAIRKADWQIEVTDG